MTALALEGVIRHYAWGSRTAIPELLGTEADGEPAAELWLGAHPDDPSGVPEHGTTLDKLIDADPEYALGAGTLARFGPRLPFLLKVLAAGTALSIQVHPTIAQARNGFAAEEARGVPRSAPQRNYRDTNHKPELICALSEFDALCGFRPVPATLALIDALELPELVPVRALLAGPDGLRAAFTHLLTLPDPRPLVDAVVAAVPRLADRWVGAGRTVALAAGDFPGDVGAVLSLLLNDVRLAPGEAIYLGAGNVHAYLRGTGVEIMANSDNVLRCGLTAKHVDVPELLKITDFTELPEPRCPAENGRFRAPARDFALTRMELAGSVVVEGTGPHIALCTSGRASVEGVGLTPGRAAFVPARDRAFEIDGTGTAFLATTGA